MCKTGQPHMWQARVSNHSDGASCPLDAGKAVCPCNNLAHNHPEVAAECDWEANGGRTPETVVPGSNIKAAWRCGLCGHRWSACVKARTNGDVPSVPVKPAAFRHAIPASAMEHHTCWLSGTGKPTRHTAGTQTKSPWAQPSRCTGSCKTSASWAWCTNGRQHHVHAWNMDHPSPLAKLCVLATP